jgi:hypothetical protein
MKTSEKPESGAARRPLRTKLKRRPVKVIREEPLLVPSAALAFHPLLKRVAMLPDLMERERKLGKIQGKNRGAHQAAAAELGDDFEALIVSIRTHGLREKIKVVKGQPGYLIVDGRHRMEAVRVIVKRYLGEGCAVARRFAEQGVPCELVAEAEVTAIIQDAVTRRHMSKGARAYLAVLMQPEVATEEKRSRGGIKTALNAVLITAEALAKRAGVSLRLIEDAIALYRKFEERKDVRKKFEDAIWVGAGLATVKAGIEGYLATGQDPEGKRETEEEKKARLSSQWLYTGLGYFNRIGRYWEEYGRLDEDQEKALIERATEVFREAPEAIREAIREVIS